MDGEDQVTDSNKTQEQVIHAIAQQSVETEESVDQDEEADKLKKMSGKERIRKITDAFDEMIEFMDFSFERAF